MQHTLAQGTFGQKEKLQEREERRSVSQAGNKTRRLTQAFY